jgi:phosphoribosylanthranilate isomerase
MQRKVAVKICGLKTAESVAAAVAAGAQYIGFNFFAKSPRSVTIAEAADLAAAVPAGVAKVALVVDPDDAMLDAIVAVVPIDIIQLHGHETPDRVTAIKARYGLPVMKVVGIAGDEDLKTLDSHLAVADMILVDAKPPKDAVLPGGNGLTFDWRLLQGRRWPLPWMLAGGLTAANVAEAIRLTGARQVDVASGVETSPGVKDAGLMAAFCAAALTA